MLAVALVVLAGGVLYATDSALAGLNFGGPDVTPWARANQPAPRASAIVVPSGSAATPRPGPFAIDLLQHGDFVGEKTDTWCVAAAMQTMMNIMDAGADGTTATQKRLFDLARSLDPAPDGASEPEGWAAGLEKLGYGDYEVAVTPTIRAAVQLAAKQLRATGRPVGLLVWRGAHSWVMSGFTATADPATTTKFTVTAVRIEDVWYPRFSTIWGYSRPPDALVTVSDLAPDFLPWKRPRGSYPDKNGQYVIVVPVT